MIVIFDFVVFLRVFPDRRLTYMTHVSFFVVDLISLCHSYRLMLRLLEVSVVDFSGFFLDLFTELLYDSEWSERLRVLTSLVVSGEHDRLFVQSTSVRNRRGCAFGISEYS